MESGGGVEFEVTATPHCTSAAALPAWTWTRGGRSAVAALTSAGSTAFLSLMLPLPPPPQAVAAAATGDDPRSPVLRAWAAVWAVTPAASSEFEIVSPVPEPDMPGKEWRSILRTGQATPRLLRWVQIDKDRRPRLRAAQNPARSSFVHKM